MVRSSYITTVEKNAPYRLHQAISTLIRIYKISETAPAENAGKKHLNPPDMQTLLFVGEHTTCIATDVAEHLRVAPTTASSIIDRLVRRGLLLRERTEENRRVVQLRLTKEGQKVQSQVLNYQLANCRAMLSALKVSEQEVFVRLISTIADTVSRAKASSSFNAR
jgi:DNA-binding MarR family transcriptional regulator